MAPRLQAPPAPPDAPETGAPDTPPAEETPTPPPSPPEKEPETSLANIPFGAYEKQPARVHARKIVHGEKLNGEPLTPGDYLIESEDGIHPVARNAFERLYAPVKVAAPLPAERVWHLDNVQIDKVPLEFRNLAGTLDYEKAVAYCNEQYAKGEKVVIPGVAIARRVER